MTADAELLRSYAQDRSESAFTELVRRHINLVYSAALREARGDVSLAEDITQAVFVELARKASRLVGHPALAGWLYTCVRQKAANVRRSETRRQRREQEARTVILIRERQAWQTLDGKWAKAYGFADGHGEVHVEPDGNFDSGKNNSWFRMRPAASKLELARSRRCITLV